VCEREEMGAALVLSFASKGRGKMAGSRGWNLGGYFCAPWCSFSQGKGQALAGFGRRKIRRGRGFCCGFGSLCFFGKGRGQPCEGEEDRERELAFFFV